MNYVEISKETISFLHKAYASLNNSPLNQEIRILVELRTSQINGCAYCCGMHSKEARKHNISQEKLDLLPAWRNSNMFSEVERVAFEYCESVTKMEKESNKEQLSKHFTEREIVDLTACISIMNTLNRLSIYLQD